VEDEWERFVEIRLEASFFLAMAKIEIENGGAERTQN
jgi:hypothetical protein